MSFRDYRFCLSRRLFQASLSKNIATEHNILMFEMLLQATCNYIFEVEGQQYRIMVNIALLSKVFNSVGGEWCS